ncbi:MAG TPA: hypothetical protein VJP02_15820 [Candidatus Sulfotelmatobacter sp.]|nr:hypothetical protein [Candidatus Sulfotelmatobacter sp.]
MSPSTRVPSVLLPSLRLRIRFLLVAITFAACVPCGVGASQPHSLTPDEAVAIDRAVRAFMQTVSHSVTQDGPMAWIKYFDASPAFFMAVNGQMAFPNAAAAQDGTRKFAQTIRKIELNWGDDLRVDPLTNEFAIVAVSWREMQVDTAGHSITETGYFTGLAEYREGHWQFRNAHWSAPVPSR